MRPGTSQVASATDEAVRVLSVSVLSFTRESSMPERDRSTDRPAPSGATPRKADQANVPRDAEADRKTDQDSQKSTASRPHGQTEDPDRTL